METVLAAWITAVAAGIAGGALAITEAALFVERRRKTGHTPGENAHL